MANAKKTPKAGKSGKPGKADKAGKGGEKKGLSPLEKARLAKKSGKGGDKKKAGKKKAALVFKAPEEFKPFFFRAAARIGKDGFVSDIKVTRVKGSLTNENAKTVDMATHDPLTMMRFATRYGTGTFASNAAKRLPAGQLIRFTGRVSVQSATGSLRVGLKDFKLVDPATKKAKSIDSKSSKELAAVYRLARKPAKFLAPAFMNVKPFPSAAELKEMNKDQESEGEVKIKSKAKAAKGKADKKAGKKKAK